MRYKFLEIRDAATCIPVLALELMSVPGGDPRIHIKNYYLRRSGYGTTPCIVLLILHSCKAKGEGADQEAGGEEDHDFAGAGDGLTRFNSTYISASSPPNQTNTPLPSSDRPLGPTTPRTLTGSPGLNFESTEVALLLAPDGFCMFSSPVTRLFSAISLGVVKRGTDYVSVPSSPRYL
jgi:hypothetical protein